VNLQHINVKLLVKNPGEADLEPLIPVFHGWIKDQIFEELLLDVADYRHVYAGPGVVLIGHQANYAVDNTDSRLGVLYNRKAELNGSSQDRLKQAARAALKAFKRLEAEPRLDGRLRFHGQEMEVFFNDRLFTPNTDATRIAAEPELQSFFAKLFRGGEYSLSYDRDPRRLFAVSVKTTQPFSVESLLENIDS